MIKAKIIKKDWYPILAPKIFQNAVLGETYVYDPKQAIGKCLAKSLMELTNDAKRQNINISFKVANVQNEEAFADVVGYDISHSSVKRLMRKNVEKILLSFLCKTSDNRNLQIKPLLITRSATIGSVAAKIRKNTQDFLVKYIGSITYDNLINDLVNHKLQNSLRNDMNKIYPLRVCEIRSMKVVDLEKKKEAKSEVAAKEARGAKEALREAKQARREESKAAEKKEKKAAKAKESKESKDEESKEEVQEADQTV